ncbi:unnamed protein product [Rotaria sp. Silwood2]|nr:unnamed protein product [Rotaria sp. Silwood2]
MINSTSNREINLENCIVIWLDATINQTDNATQSSVNDLRHIVDGVFTFYDLDQCIDYITDINDEKVFFIISGSIGIDIVPLIHELQHIESIYVFCCNTHIHEQWSKHYLKIRGVYNHIHSICYQLKRDIIQLSRNSISIQVIPSNSGQYDNNKLPVSFIYLQILRNALFQLDDFDIAKKEMIEFCRQYYVTNISELRLIDKFEANYEPTQAIWWYTGNSFVYKMLNQALRSQDIDLLYKFRFFIKDLHVQLVTLCISMLNTPNTNILYRGQGMRRNEFLQLQQNGFLSFSNFLSTTMDKALAEIYVQTSQDTVGVLFEIEGSEDVVKYNTPFTCIENLSHFPIEKEVLFSMGSIFRIKSIVKIENKEDCYRVKLMLTDTEDEELITLGKCLEKDIVDKNGLFYLAALMRVIGKYDKAIYFYQLLLKNSSLESNNPLHLSIIYNDIGWTYKEQEDYTKALEFYRKALDIDEKYLPENHEEIATVCSNIGTVYCQQHMLDEAFIYFERVTKIHQSRYQNHHILDQRYLLKDTKNMGAVHVEKGDYSKALNCFLLAKQIENEILPASQIGHGYTHKNIGGTYFKLSKYDEALIHFHKALKIQTRTLSDQHPCLIELNESIAITYLKLKNYEQALSYFKNTLNMARNSSSTNVSFIAKTYKNIGDTYTAQKEYEKSVEPYNQALTLHNSVVQDEWSRAVLYTSMGMTLWILGKFEDSLDNMEKELKKYRTKQHSNSSEKKLIVYRGLGLPNDEFEKLQKGHLISFSEFLSTSEKQELAEIYVQHGLNDIQVIFFEIELDYTIQTSTPFAQISEQSQFD